MTEAIFIVIPEGLSIDETGVFYASDYYKAALDMVMELGGEGDRVYLAPANTFGAHQPEDHFGREYLQGKGFHGMVGVIGDDVARTGYLDTLDNATYLKKHLSAIGQWPLGEVILVCNRPHRWRGYWLFRCCGYRIKKVIGTTPGVRSGHKMVRRLWFYDNRIVQYIYEMIAIAYDSIKFLTQTKI